MAPSCADLNPNCTREGKSLLALSFTNSTTTLFLVVFHSVSCSIYVFFLCSHPRGFHLPAIAHTAPISANLLQPSHCKYPRNVSLLRGKTPWHGRSATAMAPSCADLNPNCTRQGQSLLALSVTKLSSHSILGGLPFCILQYLRFLSSQRLSLNLPAIALTAP